MQVRESKPAVALHWREGLAPLLGDTGYQPLDAKALARKLHVSPEEQSVFTTFLAEEENIGRIMQVRQGLYVLPKRLGFSVGRLQMNERGFGFWCRAIRRSLIFTSRAKTRRTRFMAIWF